MSWLTAHIWLELLAAAFFGGLIGWSMRGRKAYDSAQMVADSGLKSRITQLETQLDLERKSATDLKSQLTATSILPEEKVEILPANEAEQSTAWRNRYLESRNRFLEQKVVELDEARTAAPVQTGEDLATRMTRRNLYLEGRVKYLEEELVRGGSQSAIASSVVATSTMSAVDANAGKPATLAAPRSGKADDLKEIAGIGPKLEGVLNNLGIYHFDQIASWTPAEVAWVNNAISFKGRIEREKWIEQAAALARGEATDGQTKYRDGKHT